MSIDQAAGRLADPADAHRRRRAHGRLPRRASGPGRARAARLLRHVGAPRHLDRRHVQRGPRARDRRGDRALPRRAGHRRAAVPRARHARAVGAGRADVVEVLAAHGVDVRRRRRRRLHADARDLARDPDPQPRAAATAAPTASSSRRRTTRPQDGGFKYNPPHGGPADTDVTGWIQRRGQRAARAAACRRQRARGPAATGAPPRLRLGLRRRPAGGRSTSTRSAPAGCASASTRSAARASPTGRRSPSATAWT